MSSRTSPDALRACGYSSSPLAYKNTIITTAGGKGHGVVALDEATGKIVWQSQDFQNGYSSPILIDLDGRPELIVFTFGEIAGLDPDTGGLEWSRPHESDQGVNVATPIWGDDHLLFVSSAYGGGSRVLTPGAQSRRRDGRRSLGEQARAHSLRQRGAHRVARLCVERRHGVGALRGSGRDDRRDAVARSQRHPRDARRHRRRLLLLDEDGNLVLATPGESGLEVHGKTQLLNERAWTAPTLSGTTLYVRDRHQIMAVDLGK